jgi:hypothetical protein
MTIQPAETVGLREAAEALVEWYDALKFHFEGSDLRGLMGDLRRASSSPPAAGVGRGVELYEPHIEYNNDAGFYEFVSEDVPAIWRAYAPTVEVCVSMKDRERVIGMRVFTNAGAPFAQPPEGGGVEACEHGTRRGVDCALCARETTVTRAEFEALKADHLALLAACERKGVGE